MAEIIQAIVIAIILGAFIGLQFRKNAEEKDYTSDQTFAGMRTCMAIALLGYLSVYLSTFNSLVFPIFTGFFLLLIIISQIYSSFIEKKPGGTSEISLAILYLVGVLIGFGEINIGIIITIILSIIASGRKFIYQFSDKFSSIEIIDTVKFAIIVFLILPILPNEAIDPWGVINPYHIWLMVILISGISFIGYMASKFVGKKKGILLSGFIGGAVSSTAVTTAMAIENKKNPRHINPYIMAILLASIMMYIRVIIEAAIINQALLEKLLIPIGAMLITMLGFTVHAYYARKTKKKSPKLKKEIAIESPFSLQPALKFGLFFIVILFLIKITETYLGNQGIYLSAIISSLADVDAITISLSSLSANQVIDTSTTIRAITLAVIANTFIKLLYIHFFGSKLLTKKLLSVFLVTSLVGILSSFII